MTLLLVILMILADVLLAAILGTLLDMKRSAQDTVDEVRDLRLTSRTRVRRAKVQTGVPSREEKLVRLGRSSASTRLVVGGDDDSQLNRILSGHGEVDDE